MDITVAVVTYNAAWCLRSCLESLLRQTPHGGAVEILVVDGCSNDGTQDIVRGFGDQVRLVENPKRTIASNRNIALLEARYPYIAFTDSDCVAPVGWLRSLSKAFETIRQTDAGVAAVGGGNVTPSCRSSFRAALGIALDSFLGSLGSVQGKVFDHQRLVASLGCLNVLYKCAALKSVGGFDEQLKNMCEDTDMNYRLRQKGRTLYFIPGADVEHYVRRNLRSWCASMYAYGIGRARIMCKHRTLFSPAYVLALLFLPALLIGSLIGMIWPWSLLVWLYVPAMVCAGLVLAFKKKSFLGLYIGLILLETHICYAIGLWRGLTIGYGHAPKNEPTAMADSESRFPV